ncbi:uncharacterized protein METZ01_LOCUS111958 [marine metagenome]|uniref:Uncharacterized protein n=1 Tax=marine metagenome TaxID=408172 RepID=A0A381X2X0_9ZZZZ
MQSFQKSTVVDEEYDSHPLKVTAECAYQVLNPEEHGLGLYQNEDSYYYWG